MSAEYHIFPLTSAVEKLQENRKNKSRAIVLFVECWTIADSSAQDSSSSKEVCSIPCVSKSLRRQTKMVRANLRGTAGIPVQNILKHFHPERGKLGILVTSTAKKEGENVAKEESVRAGKSEPIVAFNKPPLPPVLGPLVALSLLEMGSGREGHDE